VPSGPALEKGSSDAVRLERIATHRHRDRPGAFPECPCRSRQCRPLRDWLTV